MGNFELIEKLGIPTARSGLARSAEEAADLAGEIGYPVALKIVSSDILHKTEAGGVLLNLDSRQEVIKGYKKIVENVRFHKSDVKIEGVKVQKYFEGGTEVILGLIKDRVFGYGIMFGLGGIFTEVLEDVTYRIAPIDEKEALKMMKEIKGYRVLQGIRGQKPRDINALAKAIADFSRLGDSRPSIKEAEINPLLVFSRAEGVVAVDLRILEDGNEG